MMIVGLVKEKRRDMGQGQESHFYTKSFTPATKEKRTENKFGRCMTLSSPRSGNDFPVPLHLLHVVTHHE